MPVTHEVVGSSPIRVATSPLCGVYMPMDIPESEIVYVMEGELRNEGTIFLKAYCPTQHLGQFVYVVLDGMVIRKGCYKPTKHNGEQTLSVVWIEENIKGEKAPEIERVPVYPDPVII